MSIKYFKLNSECYLVTGRKKSIVYNLLEKKMIWLDEKQSEILKLAEIGEQADDEQIILKELVDNGWGVFSDKKIYVEKIRTKNLFSINQFYKSRPIIKSVTIQIINECNLSCLQCKTRQCPECICLDNDNIINSDDLLFVIKSLKMFGLEQVVLTGGEIALHNQLGEIIDILKSFDLRVCACTNGIEKIQNLDKIDMLFINIFDSNQMEKVRNNYQNDQVFIVMDRSLMNEEISEKWSVIRKDSIRKVTGTDDMLLLDESRFFERKYYNECLNNRIYITSNLDVVKCFGVCDVIGNIRKDNISDIVLKLYNNIWRMSKCNSENICGECEFRYSCDSCLRIDKNNCGYSMEEGRWK